MRAYEFINEARGKSRNGQQLSHNNMLATPSVHKVRDQGGYDRTYHLNRMGMAMAMADGRSKNAVKMEPCSFVEKYNTVYPYSEAEHNMIHQAMGAIPTDHKEVVNWSKSMEPDDTNHSSPIVGFSGYGKKKKKK